MRAVIAIAVLLLGSALSAQVPSLSDQQARLVTAKREAATAASRADALARQAAAERSSADRARANEAALAGRVAAAAADLTTAEARSALVDRLLADQQARLGSEQAPVARLLAALQSLARRPTIVAIAQPGSVDDLVHLRAVLDGALPVINARTQAIRGAIAATSRLQTDAAVAAIALRQGRARLEMERVALAKLEADHRRRSSALGASAMSETDRALAMGERARDIVDQLGTDQTAQATAADLVAMPGPLPRPLGPGAIPLLAGKHVYRLPVHGRLVAGLNEISDAGVRSRGLTFAVAADALVVAPASGQVRYARRFRDYGTIVIIDHGDGWTSLITGLTAPLVQPGAQIAMGTPIGYAGAGEAPRITVELRRRGRPVDIPALLG